MSSPLLPWVLTLAVLVLVVAGVPPVVLVLLVIALWVALSGEAHDN